MLWINLGEISCEIAELPTWGYLKGEMVLSWLIYCLRYFGGVVVSTIKGRFLVCSLLSK